MSGLMSYCAGQSAEAQVAADFAARGYELRAERWRGAAGEIDLILQQADELVFVEVKKSRSFAAAAARISPAQQQRIMAAAQEYLACMPSGLDTPCRVDVALVDSMGRIEIRENAFL
ncbi:YraN family protein [Pseudoruegeria sp. SK021]|uniref:YraN family protein n=1 Tax=Pseudoruegeria sp. SK021 TaxID=1933035 RepID=UPI000A249144|nr:YraN family protein [Pseudoruegeria sp. SK021]OSP56068.1 hypothetical protein BV911_03790 [Pseudoruegeria sp. SK021]